MKVEVLPTQEYNAAEMLNEIFNPTDAQEKFADVDELTLEVRRLRDNPLPEMPPMKRVKRKENCDEKDLNVTERLCQLIRSGNVAEAKKTFNLWEKSLRSTFPQKRKRKVCTCPVGFQDKTDLVVHLVRVHQITEENAKSYKSGISSNNERKRLANEQRKTKPRFYRKKICPILGCSKVVVRIENHLGETHKIKDNKKFKAALKEAIAFEEFTPKNGLSEDSATSSCSESSEREEENKIMRNGGMKYLKVAENMSPVNSNDSSDEDWFSRKVRNIAERRREERKRRTSERQEETVLVKHRKSSSTISRAPSIASVGPLSVDLEETEEIEPDSNFPIFNETLAPSITTIEPLSVRFEEKQEQEPVRSKLPITSKNDSLECRIEDLDGSEDEDEEDENMDIIITPWRNESHFDKFELWLVSPDGKRKNKRAAKQHSRQVQLILKDTSQDSYELSVLFDRMKIRNQWLLNFEKRRKAGTIKSYLHSLCHFYKYILCDTPVLFKDFVKDCPSMIVIMENWIVEYRKKAKSDKWMKDLEQLDQLITAEEVKTFDNSTHVSNCRRNIKEVLATGKVPTFKQFTSVRDYILTYLCLDNASRTGALANMTTKEFMTGKMENGVYIVSVFNHKTIATSGPATICFTANLYKESSIFFQHFRNRLEGLDDEKGSANNPFFTSWSGNKMSSSMATGQLNSFWNKAVGRSLLRPRLNATLVRKTCVTKTHSLRPELEQQLANLMCHSKATARRSYFLQEKSKNAAETSRELRSVLRQTGNNVDVSLEDAIKVHFAKEISDGKITLTVVKEKSTLHPSFFNLTSLQLRDKIRYFIMSKTKRQNNDEVRDKELTVHEPEASFNDNEALISDNTSISTCETTSSLFGTRKDRVKFSSEDNQSIWGKFGDLITGSILIKEADIRSASKADRVVKDLIEKYGVTTIVMKVRTEKKKFAKDNAS
ncbi:uncharacterized protein LOC130641636 [Hydractinia symbiolongicarpus]|uniref:uncharacterized protein LOC130641636 n=1 Tax=Hydractinia symbiolongicarpus TaxID=13093 RepID=UPI00254E9844|nr:uncharacterized protein LOC130641636 [Hydractinia symbiolongicarpus]